MRMFFLKIENSQQVFRIANLPIYGLIYLTVLWSTYDPKKAMQIYYNCYKEVSILVDLLLFHPQTMWNKVPTFGLETAMDRTKPRVINIVTLTMALPRLPSEQIPKSIEVSCSFFKFMNYKILIFSISQKTIRHFFPLQDFSDFFVHGFDRKKSYE